MSARTFQVGDRVRISGWGSNGLHEGTVTEIEPPDPDGRFGPYIVTDCRYTSDNGRPAIACGALTDDGTAGYGCTVELIEAVEDQEDVGVIEYECPEPRCTFHVGAAGPLDPDELDDFAADVRAHVESHGPGTDLIVRPFQVGDTVEIDGQRGTVHSMVENFMFGNCVVLATVAVDGPPFPTWDGIYLTADRTRQCGVLERTLVWVDDVEPDSDERLVDSFAPPADAEPYDDGHIPTVMPVLSDYCPVTFDHRHQFDGVDVCLGCDAEEPPARPTPARFSQAGLMSIAKVA